MRRKGLLTYPCRSTCTGGKSESSQEERGLHGAETGAVQRMATETGPRSGVDRFLRRPRNQLRHEVENQAGTVSNVRRASLKIFARLLTETFVGTQP
jgi:hypothetical protein